MNNLMSLYDLKQLTREELIEGLMLVHYANFTPWTPDIVWGIVRKKYQDMDLGELRLKYHREVNEWET